MFGWFKRAECRCNHIVIPAAPPKSDCVPLTSPARALERSLTDPETRGEWAYEWVGGAIGDGHARYYNAARDLLLTRYYGSFGESYISTPFTLNGAEQAVVLDALKKLDAHRQQTRELAALSRLTAQAGAARSDETPKVARPKASTRSRRDAP